MNHSSKLQILVVGEIQNKKWEGREYQVQEAECILLNDDGSPQAVAVLRLDDSMRGDKAPKTGIYSATFSLRPNPKDRRLEARLTGITPIDAGRPRAAGQPS